jgi:hypothetical protein
MSHRFTRLELYHLAWSEPMRTLAARFGVSDVWLAKACRRADIPVPERGYWARLRVRAKVTQRPLPARGLGVSDMVRVGERRFESYLRAEDHVLSEPIPAPPTFDEDLRSVEQRVRQLVGKVAAPHPKTRLHPLTSRLLDEDERRRQTRASRSYPWPSDAPLFGLPIERRRLRLLNAVFLALQRCGATPWIHDRPGSDTGVTVGDQEISFTLDRVTERAPARGKSGDKTSKSRETLQFTIGHRTSMEPRTAWEDSADRNLEQCLTEIVVELLVAGEARYRERALYTCEWWIRRREELDEEDRSYKAEQVRKERERVAKLEKERLERLFAAADAWRRANDLRTFVAAVKAANREVAELTARERLERWVKDALQAADRLDPLLQSHHLSFEDT